MRRALLAFMLCTLSAQAMAQARRVDPYQPQSGASDQAWRPNAYDLQTVPDTGTAAVRGLSSTGTVTNTDVVTPPEPPRPVERTAQWYWADRMWCITTPTGRGGYDSIQYQYCVGDGCTERERGCYAVNWGGYGTLSVPAGTAADNNYCYSYNYCRGYGG